MSSTAFAAIMLIIFFVFVAAMIWAYRKNDYTEEKPKVETMTLNTFDDTLNTITTYSEAAKKQIEEKKKAEEEKKKEEENNKDPLLKIETESRKKMMQDKNHIKKSAADEYFEKTKNMANEILQPKT